MQRSLKFLSSVLLVWLATSGWLAAFGQITPTFYAQLEKQPAISAIDTGWYFGTFFGFTDWGETATCGCSAINISMNAGYETVRGVNFGLRSSITRTLWDMVEVQGTLGYFPALGKKQRRVFGAVAGVGTPIILNRLNFRVDEHRGLTRFYELQLRGHLGQRKNTRVVIAAGVSTLSERYEVGGRFDGRPTITRLKHSGLHLRLGVVW